MRIAGKDSAGYSAIGAVAPQTNQIATPGYRFDRNELNVDLFGEDEARVGSMFPSPLAPAERHCACRRSGVRRGEECLFPPHPEGEGDGGASSTVAAASSFFAFQ